MAKKTSHVPNLNQLLSKMESDWDARAQEAAEFYVASARHDWHKEDFFRSGELNVENEILADPDICRGRAPRDMRVLEIGCGTGRMTRALAQAFGEVHAVDISAEMLTIASRNLAGLNNVRVHKNNGSDLAGLGTDQFDLAFSFIVFQHIPSMAVIENYIREVHRCLKPGSMFKLQVQGDPGFPVNDSDTWVGVPVSVSDAIVLAHRSGFDLLRHSGEDTQYFWLWFLKPRWHWVPRRVRHAARRCSELVRIVSTRRIQVRFHPSSISPGHEYMVRIPTFANEVIDVEYELIPAGPARPTCGVVARWCELDSEGQACIQVPSEHLASTVRITRVRSRTKQTRWFPSEGSLQIVDRSH